MALFGVVGLAAVVIALAERVWPYRRVWLEPHDDVRTDVLHLVFSTGLAAGGRWLVALVLGGTVVAAPVSLWPVTWPIGGQLGLALLIEEFCAYWIHRA